MKVLISGASIAGPALAYWLSRSGFTVTVVEKANTLRSGGYPIDIRGSAVEVVRRMGILPQLRQAHVDARRATFLDSDGSTVATVSLGSGTTDDLEVRRGDLAEALHSLVRDDVEFLFNDSIETLNETIAGIDVSFRSGRRRTFDLVIGADGMHSQTRASVFGPEEQFSRHLGRRFAIFSMPNIYDLSHELMVWNAPGRTAALYAVGDPDQVYGFFTYADAKKAEAAEVFAEDGWEIPSMIKAMHQADDLFTDTVSQIRMPHWSSGRVALVGDAAHAPSFLTGQGSSLALAGAYMLAHALATQPGHTAAFTAYERGTRDFVAQNQALVGNGESMMYPLTQQALDARNTLLRNLNGTPSSTAHPAHSALQLP
ncbi:FAD-dependent monooxygenase [Kineosporia babensis]|uniref:FAD-dependent monooxygenase n=1 Tax=Kineosporia babensis TaxID=499548 RepID=A0A9X1T3K8_9ACTN|nr:FAD-dependent monooxygenase [Kineosporia babensis]MCD5315763.1 FAD-dependent monooxygenase [Kineosporia babensis]